VKKRRWRPRPCHLWGQGKFRTALAMTDGGRNSPVVTAMALEATIRETEGMGMKRGVMRAHQNEYRRRRWLGDDGRRRGADGTLRWVPTLWLRLSRVGLEQRGAAGRAKTGSRPSYKEAEARGKTLPRWSVGAGSCCWLCSIASDSERLEEGGEDDGWARDASDTEGTRRRCGFWSVMGQPM
jgi:hypothetical protein